MAIEDALVVLLGHWDDVVARMDVESQDALAGLLGALGEPGQPDATAGIADLLVETLPRDHPVRRALAGGTMFAPATLDWPGLTNRLRELSVTGALGGTDPPGGWVFRDVTGRLLREPAFNERQLRELGADPADPDLIRLPRSDGRHQWPTFQFASSGADPVPDVVRRVNRVLGGRDDPVGAADWWLSKNGWLGEAPSRLLGEVADDLLVQAALAVVQEV